MKRKDLARRATSAALAACMMFTLSAPALAESTDALMQLSIGSYRSSSLLSEENGLPAITVNGVTVDDSNKDDILDGQNKGKLSYDATTNTLKCNKTIQGDLTIDAPGVNIVLDNPNNLVIFGKLTVTNAQDVKVTSQDRLAVFGAVEISCDGEVEITSGESYAVTNNVTVKRASKVAISGKSDTNHIVTGDVTIACPVPVTIRNNSTGGMANSIVYSGGKYVYSDTEGGKPVDPSSTPINASANAVYITPAVAHALTVKNGTSKVGGADASTAYADQTVTVTPNDRTAEGYQFVRWEVVSGITDAELNRSTTDNTATFTMPGKDVELKARYNKLYTITAEKGIASLTQAIQGTEVTITANTIPGRKFDHWVVKSGGVTLTNPKSDKTTFKMLEDNVTVEAKYKAIQPITVNGGTYTVNGTAAAEAVKDDKIVATAQDAPAGKKFAGWTAKGINLTDEQKKSPVVKFEMPKNAVVLTAQYKTLHPVTVTNGKADKPTAAAGDTVTITPNSRLDEKLKFDRWVVKSGKVTLNGIKTATFTMPDEPVELEAVYNNLYTVTVNDGTNTTTTNGVAGTEVTVTANVPAGEKFTGWKVENNTALSLNGKSIDLTQREITFNMPSTDITLTAEHKTIHTLTVVGGTIDGAADNTTIQAIAGDTITVHSKLDADQQFLHWTSEGMGLSKTESKNDPLTITMPDHDVTITAVPKQLYTVTVTNGTVRNQSEATVNPGDPVTIQAANRTALGEVFVGWTVTSLDANGQPNVKLDNPTAESTTFTMIGANVEVEANYKKLHTVTVRSQMEGEQPTENTDLSQKKIEGKDISIAVPGTIGEDWIFDHWEVEVGGHTVTDLFDDYSKPVAEFKMQDADVKLTAVYRKLYTITIINNVNDDVGGTRKTKVGGTVSLEAAPISGYRFKNWKVLRVDADVSDAGILTLKGDGDVLVQAEYVKLYNLTVNYGTAVNKTVETETTTDGDGRIVLPAADGDSITATANGTTPDQIFTGWTSNVPLTKDGIELTEDELKNPEITFDMPAGAVTLTATYSYVHDQTVTVVNGTAYTGDTPAAAEITVTPGETVYIEPADRWKENLIFTEWEVTSGKGVSLEYDENGTHFVMPQSDEIVKITAQYAKLNAVTINDGDVIGADGHGINNMNDGKPGAIAGTNITIKAKDKSAEGKVFDYWEIITGDNVTLTSVNDDGSVATFEMIGEDVEITAKYANVHDVTVHSDDLSYSKTFEDIKVGTTYKVTAPEIPGKRFSRWVVNLGDVTDLVTDLAERTGTFTMPDGNVDLTAEYVGLNGVTVKYGTAVNKTVETETTTDGDGRIVLPAAAGDDITVTADEPYPTETFEGWTLINGTIHDDSGDALTTDEEGYILNADGTRLTKRSFTFVMGGGAVELKANYSMPAYVMPQWVTVEGGTAFAEGEAAAAEISADPGKRITVSADPNADPNMIFDYWEVTSLDEDGKATVKLEDATSMTTSFTMPMAPVKLTAHWRTIDEAPSSSGGGAGAAIAGVAIGGAAVWGGYEIATRVILNDLLPAGAAIPANRGQLALLIWTEKGKPEPAAQPAFADITDAEQAKAAQWCVEQGLLDAREGKFEPDGWMPKFKTIEIWNKAFPKK